MALGAGVQMGPYEIVTTIGAGGMGEARADAGGWRSYSLIGGRAEIVVAIQSLAEVSNPLSFVLNWTATLNRK